MKRVPRTRLRFTMRVARVNERAIARLGVRGSKSRHVGLKVFLVLIHRFNLIRRALFRVTRTVVPSRSGAAVAVLKSRLVWKGDGKLGCVDAPCTQSHHHTNVHTGQ